MSEAKMDLLQILFGISLLVWGCNQAPKDPVHCECLKCNSDWAAYADIVAKAQAGKCICREDCSCDVCPVSVVSARGQAECTCETAKTREPTKCRDNQ